MRSLEGPQENRGLGNRAVNAVKWRMCQRKGVVGAGGSSLAAPWFRGQRLVPAVVACRLPTAWPDVFVADVNAPLGCVLNLQRCFHSNFVLCFPPRSRSLR